MCLFLHHCGQLWIGHSCVLIFRGDRTLDLNGVFVSGSQVLECSPLMRLSQGSDGEVLKTHDQLGGGDPR